MENSTFEENDDTCMFGNDEDSGSQIPTQAQSVVEGSGGVLVSEFRPLPDVDYIQVSNYSVVHCSSQF